MDTADELVKVIKRMGYRGKIPHKKDLLSIINPRTEHISEQLLKKIRSRKEVLLVRRNMVFAAAEADLANKIDTIDCKQFKNIKKKIEMQKHIEILKQMIVEKEKESKESLKDMQVRRLKINNAHEELNEKQMKEHILELKCQQLQQDTNECNRLIKSVKTPEECDFSVDKGIVMENLKAAMKKLLEITKEEFLAQVETDSYLDVPCNNMPRCSSPIEKANIQECSHSAKAQNILEEKILCKEDLSKEFKNLKEGNEVTVMWSLLKDINNSNKNKCAENLKACQSQIDVKLCPEKTAEYKCMMAKLYAMDVTQKLKKLKIILNKPQLMDAENLVSSFSSFSANLNNDKTIFGQSTEFIESNTETSLEDHSIIKMLNKEIECLQNTATCDEKLAKILKKSAEVEEEINSTTKEIRLKMGMIKSIYDTFPYKRHQRFTAVVSLQRFSAELNWAISLKMDYFTKETEALVDFPIQYYNAHFLNMEPLNFTHLALSSHEPLDNYTIFILSSILQPGRTVEYILAYLYQKKLFLDYLKSSQKIIQPLLSKTYTSEELQEKEAYLRCSIEKLQQIARKPRSISLKNIENLVKTWIDMPFDDFVFPTRLFNDKTYKEYENVYLELQKQLPKDER